ncbi:MAG: hypothetical protein ACRDCC_04845 [Culicoidibacterales bacterium]
MEMSINILVSIATSIIASIVIFGATSLYRFRYKQQIYYHMNVAKNYIIQIENHVDYPCDYQLVMHNVEQLHDRLLKIYNCIYPFSMWWKPKNKKLGYTIIYSAMRRCELSLFTTIGYDDEYEKEARLVKLKKYCYDKSIPNTKSVLTFELDLLVLLLDCRSISSALAGLEINNFEKLIDVNSFKQKGKCNKIYYFIRQKGITQKQLEKYLTK